MNFKTFLACVVILFIITIASAAYATFPHSAFRLADGKTIDLFGTLGMGNGTIKDIWCAGNCSGFSNISGNGTDLYLSGNLTAKQIGGVVYADQYATIQDAINASASTGSIIELSPGIYNLTQTYVMPSGTANKAILLCSMTAGAKNGIWLKGAGMNATILKYNGVDTNQASVVGSCYDANSITGHPQQNDITISDLTIDVNGKGAVGLVIENTDGFNVENLRVKNQNRLNSAGISVGIAVYGRNGVLENIHIDPGMSTANTDMTGITENALQAGILFDSVGAYNIYASNLFIDGGGNSVMQTGIGFEDYPRDIHISNYLIHDTAVYGLKTSTINTKNFSFRDGTIYNVPNLMNLGAMGNIILSGLFAWNMTTNNNNMILSVVNSSITDVYLDNSGNSNTFGDDAIALISANGNNLKNINVKNTKTNHAAIEFLQSSNNVLDGGKLDHNSGSGVWIDPGNDGLSQNNTVINMAVTNNLQRPFVTGTSTGNLIQNNREIGNGNIDYDYSTAGNFFKNNFGASPYNFGNSATAPAAFGAGDTYFNYTKNAQCVYTTSWVFIGNSTGVC